MLRNLSASLTVIATLSLSMTPAWAQTAPAPAIQPAPALPGEDALETAWQQYYAAIKKTHDDILASEQYKLFPQQRALGYYSLLEAQAIAYNFALAPQLASPRVYRATSWQTELYTLGGNSGDFQYATVFLDGKLTYTLKGNMNDSKVLLADWAAALPGNGKAQTKSYDFSKFQIGKDGSFEVTLSATETKGNWIKLDPDAKFQWLLFRPMTGKWTAKPARFAIERISPVDLDAYRAKETSPAAVAERIGFAAGYLTFMVDQWNIDFYKRMQANAGGAENQFATLSQKTAGDVGSPSAQYIQGVFALDKDEAVVIEMDGPPGGPFWTVQLFDAWLKSIDFRTRQSSINLDQAARDPDGKYRFVITAKDPGYANWLDTGGLERGMMLVRNYLSPQPAPVPKAYRVKLSALGDIMKGSAKVTPTQRQEELRRREAAHIARIGE